MTHGCFSGVEVECNPTGFLPEGYSVTLLLSSDIGKVVLSNIIGCRWVQQMCPQLRLGAWLCVPVVPHCQTGLHTAAVMDTAQLPQGIKATDGGGQTGVSRG
jgi:hypothetical protein